MGKYQRQVEETGNEPDDVASVPIIENKSSKKKCFGDGFKVLVIGCIIFCAAITIGLFVDIYYLRKPIPHAAVVTSAPQCTKIASDILVDSDNVIDAAVGAMICLAVVRPDQCSLASGGYMLFHSSVGSVIGEKSLDFQFAAPKDVKNLKEKVAIPGLIVGLQAANKLYGSIPFPKLVEPSIKLAAEGFVVSNSTAANLKKLPVDIQKNYFVDGKLAEAGDKLKLSALSKTLTKLINGNYSIADDMIKTMASRNGSMTQDDFAKYKPLWRTPLDINLKGKKVVSTDVPSTGVLLLSALNVLDQFTKMNTSRSFAVAAADLMFMFQNAVALQDPAFDPLQHNITRRLLSKAEAEYIASEIKSILGLPKPKGDDTNINKTTSSATVSIINLKGEAVSVVSSLGDIFGSKIITDAGVVLNNGLSLFSTRGQRNRIEGYKRPVSFATPSFIVTDGTISAFAPSADTEGLASAVQVLKNILFDSMEGELSVKYPRVFYDTRSKQLAVETERFASAGLQKVVASLKSKFTVRDVESVGSVDAVFNHGLTEAVPDSR